MTPPRGTEGAGGGERADLEALRADAVAIFRAAVAAADPAALVRRCLVLGEEGSVVIAGEEIRPPSRLRAVAFGKAACAMAEAAAALLPAATFVEPGIAVTNDENARPVERFEVLAAGHPSPDARGAAAAARVEAYLSGAQHGDGLLVLISGGGSALLVSPAEGLALEDKARVTELLLRSGADIREINAVRKHLSRLKGGGLAARAQPAGVESLILSDVIGDDLSSIASGPTAPDPTTFAGARAILEWRRIWNALPPAARERLERGTRGEVPETPKPGNPLFARVVNRIGGGNRISLEAAAEAARALRYATSVAASELTGEARVAAAFLARVAAEEDDDGPRAVLAGGETTVTVRGAGKGGRNQELALAFALAMAGDEGAAGVSRRPWVFLSAGTDGRDGPTDAAGAVVDAGTIARGRRAGLDPERALEDNDSHTFLEAAGNLLRTGATGTNVADIQVYIEG